MTPMRRTLVGVVGALLLVGAALSLHAQVQRPWRNGSVWQITFVKTKAGMDSAYLTYLAGQWKQEQEALKKEGLTLSYKVIGAESHGPTDWNMMLMTEWKDLATMEAGEPKADALGQKMFGGDQKIQAGYKERLDIREILGDRLAREIILQ
jgi:hypothetical protein